MKQILISLFLLPLVLYSETKFELHLIKETDKQSELWKQSIWMIDIDKLELAESPLITASDIKSFHINKDQEDGLKLLLKEPKEVKLKKGTMTYYVISINDKRVLLGELVSPFSSIRLPGINCTGMSRDHKITEVNIPSSSKELNIFIRELYKNKKYK